MIQPGDLIVCCPEHGPFVGGLFTFFKKGVMLNMIDDDCYRALVIAVDARKWGPNRAMFVFTGENIGWTWCSNWKKVEL